MNKLFIKINTREHGAKEKVFGFFFSSVFLLAVLFLFIFSSFAFTTEAAINKQINYQGKLTDALNVAVPNGSYNMEFKLYDSVSSVLWTETRTGSSRVQVTSGLFSVMLGDVSSLASVDFNQTLYLGVNIGGTDVSPAWDGEMTPRKKLGAVPAAVESERVGGFTPSQTPVGNNIPVLTDGALTMTGGINSGSINSSNYITTNNSPIPSWGGDGSIYAAGVSGQGIMMGVQIPDTPNSWGGHTIGYIGTTNPKWFIGISKYNSDQNTLVYAEDSLATQVRFAITPGGYVGIGTKTPTARLQITAGSSAEGNAPLKFTSGTNLGTPEAGAMEYDGTNLYFTPSGTTRETVAYQSDLTGGYVPYTGATDDLNLGVNNLTVDTNTLFVDSSNHRLGIGTTTPDSKIEFYGTNNQTTANMTDAGSRLSNLALNSDSADSGAGAAITFGNVQSKSAGSLGWAAIKAFLQDGTANTKGDLAFSTRNSVSDTELTERMRISASGNIGIGTTNPGYLLSLKNATNPSMSFETTNYRYQVGTIEDDGMFHIKRNDGLVADRMIIDVNGNIGIGTTTPTYKLEVSGISATDGIRTTGGLDFNLVDDPIAPTLALINTPGNVDAGTHTYYVSYLTDTGETHATRQTVAITTDASNGQVTVTIPVSSDGRVTGRKLYRTKAGASYWNPYYLATIPNNTDTTYIDNISDASLTGSAGVGIYRANTTNNLLTIEGAKSMLIDSNATFMGFGTGSANPSAGNLLFVGNYAGQNLTSGYATTFLGSYAGQSTTTGVSNSFVGAYSGTANTTGGSNSYLGTYAGTNNQTGVNNVAVGAQALQGVSTNSHSGNTSIGAFSMFANTTGGNNSALGHNALYANTTGSNNTVLGYNSARYQSDGTTALTDAENSVYLGYGTRGKDNTDSNSIVVGYNAIGQGANTAVWGNTNIIDHFFSGDVGISTSAAPSYKLQVGNNSVAGIVARFENSTGTCDINPTTSSLSCSSDINLKKNIQTLDDMEFNLQTIPEIENDSILNRINLLTPVVYNWNTEDDGEDKHVGFIAQEMEQLFPDLVFTDQNTGLKSVAYANITPYLVKAIQEMNLKVEEINDLEKENSWRDSLIAWFSNSTNGIESLFSKEIHTDKVCVKKSDGTERCLTGDEIDTIFGVESLPQQNNQSANDSSNGDDEDDTPADVPGNDEGVGGSTGGTTESGEGATLGEQDSNEGGTQDDANEGSDQQEPASTSPSGSGTDQPGSDEGQGDSQNTTATNTNTESSNSTTSTATTTTTTTTNTNTSN